MSSLSDVNARREQPACASVRTVYLDYAAATPVDPEVVQAMLPYLTERFANPSAPYAEARAVRAELEGARATIARLLGARPAALTFTAGATEANNIAFAATEGPVVTTAIEHESVLACARARSATIVGVDAQGFVSPRDIERALTPETTLVSVALANGEIGTIQPLRELGAVVERERRRRLTAGERVPLYLHTDASQALGARKVQVSSLGADLVTLSAAKIYGPKQVGLIWAGDGVRLRPLVLGGGQEGGIRSGTEDVAGIVGFARAMELADLRRREDAARIGRLRERLLGQLRRAFSWMVVSGPTQAKRRLPSILAVSFPGLEARRLVVLLERRGLSVGTGSACAASKMRVSHVLGAIGLDEAQAAANLRLSLGRQTSEEDVDYAAEVIADVIRQECARLGVDAATGM